MNRFEQEYYANMNSIAKSLEKIASALEGNSKKDENITAVTPTGGTIYYKTRRDMYMDNPCTKEEYEAHKANNIPGFEGTLDALDNLCNVGTNPKNDPERDKFGNDIPCKIDGITNDSDYRIRLVASNYEDGYATKKDAILDYVESEFGSEGAKYTDIIKFAYYLGAPNAPKYTSENRGYYSCAFSFRMNGHLIQGGKDYLVKGINDEGKERYFTLSKVNYHTGYWKRIGR